MNLLTTLSCYYVEEISFMYLYVSIIISYEPGREKTGLRDFRPGLTQTGLCSRRRWLVA